MKLFLYKVNGIPKLEASSDRRLLFGVQSISEQDNLAELLVAPEDTDDLSKLQTDTNCALAIENDTRTEVNFRYFRIVAFEINPEAEGHKVKILIKNLD